MSLEDMTAAVRRKVNENPKFGHTVLIDLGTDGVIFVDGTQVPAVITNEREEAETTLTLPTSLFTKMLNGDGGATMAYMTGKLKISGSVGVALKLNSMLDD
jgi:putative sterol carrier protein